MERLTDAAVIKFSQNLFATRFNKFHHPVNHTTLCLRAQYAQLKHDFKKGFIKFNRFFYITKKS
jgi:hypothetical protein